MPRVPVAFWRATTTPPRLAVAVTATSLPGRVDFPETKFVLAHFGNPWIMDAAEVVYKNMNVWTDLSGLMIGDATAFSATERQDLLNDLRADVRRAFRYAERPNRFVFGTDWPLAPMAAYRDFIHSVVPQVNYEQVFEDNARKLFGISPS